MKHRDEYITNSPLQTKKLGEMVARKITQCASEKKNAQVIALVGDLGGGKTTFLQGFAKGLGVKEKILSPTFVILKKFQVPTKTYDLKAKTFIHIDCYRIKKSKEILDLDFRDITTDPKNIVAVEWADKIKKLIPRDALWIHFGFIDEKTRQIAYELRWTVLS